ncbi:MAG: type II toxin-antitoxin system Phd/YefM family antitoxin [Caldilineaceae bacterium]|nr:type II toxin-antitoxin system Phd/YefM family antitoxin [Caldilineaceae bacterium]
MMRIYTYSEARQRLADVLDQAVEDGEVRIRRRDGTVFVIRPEVSEKSPLDVEGVDVDFDVDEMLSFIREGREGRY